MSGTNMKRIVMRNIAFQIKATLRTYNSGGVSGISTLLLILCFLSWVLCITMFAIICCITFGRSDICSNIV